MELELRLVRARVWLCSSLCQAQDGFLSLARVGHAAHVAHATLRPQDASFPSHKHFRSVVVAWDEHVANRTTFHLPERELPRLDVQLFALRSRASANATPKPQYVAASGWQLSPQDVEALASAKEVVFLTTLQAQLGTLEVALRCVTRAGGQDAQGAATATAAATDKAEARDGAFHVDWSSSDALQRDLAHRAQAKAEADEKLIAQLQRVAERAARLLDARALVLAHLRRSHAAAKVQRCFRARRRRRREQLELARREHEARAAAKKAQVRDNVIARNRQRALAMRARLLAHMEAECGGVTDKAEHEAGPETPMSVVMTRLMSEQAEAERRRLKGRLARLELQRERTLQRMRRDRGGQQQQPQPQPGISLDGALVHAVQALHFPRSSLPSNQSHQ